MSKAENVNDNNIENEIDIDIFGLSYDETRLLFSCQYTLIQNDIEKETNSERKKEKSLWLNAWLKKMNIFLANTSKKDNVHYIDEKVAVDLASLVLLSRKVRDNLNGNKTALYLILLETVLFTPYYKLEKHEKDSKLKINTKTQNISLCKIASLLDIDKKYVEIFSSSYNNSKNKLTGFWTKVLITGLLGSVLIALTAGFAAPFIASAFAGAGLSGAAAVSAGLAALGGGAIAAGGLGMAGGIAVVVGGGAILGGVSGGVAGALLSSSPDFALSQAAKLEVVMKEIILGSQKDVVMAQNVLARQQETIQSLEKELQQMKLDAAANKVKMKNLSSSISYLKTALEHNTEFVKVA